MRDWVSWGSSLACETGLAWEVGSRGIFMSSKCLFEFGLWRSRRYKGVQGQRSSFCYCNSDKLAFSSRIIDKVDCFLYACFVSLVFCCIFFQGCIEIHMHTCIT